MGKMPLEINLVNTNGQVIDKMYKQLNKLKEKSHNKKRSERLPPPPDPSDLVQDEKLETYQDAVDEFSEQLEA